MTDDELHELVHRVELRLDRVDTRLEAMEERLTEGFTQLHARLEGLVSRVNTKAGNWVVSLWAPPWRC